MKRVLLFVVLIIAFKSSNAEIMDVDFDTSMGIEEQGRYNLMLRDGTKSKKMLDFFRNLYNKNLPSKVAASVHPKIPKIIHRIWIGPRSFPENYKKCLESCKKLHPDWQFVLWTNKDIEKILDTIPEYRWLFNEYKDKKVSYQAQKDILEYLILYKYGGIYLDSDVECLQNMNEIVHKYKFFASIEPPSRWSKTLVISNRVVGASPGNKIIIDSLKVSALAYKSIYSYKNNNPIKQVIRRFFKGKNIKIPDPKKALMCSLTKAVEKNGLQSETIVFPATYCDPIFPQAKRYDVLDEIKVIWGINKNKNKLFNALTPEAISVATDFVPLEKALVMEKTGE